MTKKELIYIMLIEELSEVIMELHNKNEKELEREIIDLLVVIKLLGKEESKFNYSKNKRLDYLKLHPYIEQDLNGINITISPFKILHESQKITCKVLRFGELGWNPLIENSKSNIATLLLYLDLLMVYISQTLKLQNLKEVLELNKSKNFKNIYKKKKEYLELSLGGKK